MITYLPELLTATLCGAAIGLERTYKAKPAGARTCALVALGSALFSILSQHFASADPTRIAAQIVTGIGFLGAGTIIVDKNKVIGLTTSAIVWVVAALGMAAGFGQIYLSALATAMTLGVIYLVGLLEWRVVEKRNTKRR